MGCGPLRASDGVAVGSLFNCPDPFRARYTWARDAECGWYAVSGDKTCPQHLVVHCPQSAKALLDAFEPTGTVWKPSGGRGVFDRLLQHATTKAGPESWGRMRQAVQTAIGNPDSFSARFSDAASAAAAKLVAGLLPGAGGVHDIKRAVEAASCAAICAAVCGAAPRVESSLLEMWRFVRMPAEKRTPSWFADALRKSDAFRAAVREERERAHGGIRAGKLPENSTSLMALLVADGTLDAAEVCDNVHSFLIAGYEAINCLTLFSLLHLAHAPATQGAVAEEVRAKLGKHGGLPLDAVADCPTLCGAVGETLRMYPPVLSLPRTVMCPGLVLASVGPSRADDGPLPHADFGLAGAPATLPRGTRITVCTAACSRYASPGMDLEAPWEWRPSRPEGCSQMAPFGCGPRRCPGGQIALGLVRAMVGHACASLVMEPGGQPEEHGGHAEGDGMAVGCPAHDMSPPRYEWEHRLRQVPTVCLAGPAAVSARARGDHADPCAAPATGAACRDLLPWLPGEALTPAVVASSRTRSRCWVLLGRAVYDVTSFLDEHPGGASILLQYAGQEASRQFAEHHGASARKLLDRYHLGELQGDAPEGALGPKCPPLPPVAGFQSARLLRSDVVSTSARRLVLEFPAAAAQPLAPGGHMSLRLEGSSCARSYTPVQVSDTGRVMHFVVKRYEGGAVSTGLHALPVGSCVLARGPLPCAFTLPAGRHGALLLLAGGTGVAPILGLARAAAAAARRTFVLVSDSAAGDALLREELSQLGSAHSELVSIRRVFTRETGRRIDAALASEFFPPAAASVAAVVCGPPAFDADLGTMMRQLGYDTTVLGE